MGDEKLYLELVTVELKSYLPRIKRASWCFAPRAMANVYDYCDL